MKLLASALTLVSLLHSVALANTIMGKASVVDGDTIVVRGWFKPAAIFASRRKRVRR